MFMENFVQSLRLWMRKAVSDRVSDSRSTTTATQASPKMKWLSRSLKFMAGVMYSEVITRARLAVPLATASMALDMPKVAEEQPTAMS
jgi:hypothetical protein